MASRGPINLINLTNLWPDHVGWQDPGVESGARTAPRALPATQIGHRLAQIDQMDWS